jgi:hypothetical protein
LPKPNRSSPRSKELNRSLPIFGKQALEFLGVGSGLGIENQSSIAIGSGKW